MDLFVSWRDISYEPIEIAGTGGSGEVSLAMATCGPNKGVLFAVKVFTPNSSEKDDWKKAFMREVHVLRDCNHPAIVKVFDEGVDVRRRPFFVMEYLPITLWEAMKRVPPLDELAKINIVIQLLSALNYLSRRDSYVVHRDIKPKKIFLRGESCLLGDFGLVYQDETTAATDRRKGTIPAMAQMYRTPELVEYQKTGKKPPAVSDIFQLGLVAAELFTGKNPLLHGGPSGPLKLEQLGPLPVGPNRESVHARLEEMLVLDTQARLPAEVLLPRWLDLYRAARGNRERKPRAPVVSDPAVSSAESDETRGRVDKPQEF